MSFAESIGQLLFGVVLNALLLAAVLGWMARILPGASRPAPRTTLASAEFLLLFGITLSACVVLIVTLGGSLGRASNRAAMLAVTAAIGIVAAIGAPLRDHLDKVRGAARALVDAVARLAGRIGKDPPARIALCCIAAPWLLLLVDRIFAPPVAWDALTYHLTFPLHWIQTGQLDTLVQPTGEPSSPFYPLVGEMHYYWGFLSLGTDAWSAFSQVPFLLLSSIAVAGIARALGAAPIGAILAAAFWAGIPVVLRQSVEPMVDLVSTAFFLSAVFLFLRWREQGESWRLAAGAAALGLTLGGKYVGLVWVLGASPLYLATIVGGRKSVRASVLFVSLALCLAVGGYAYARNVWVGGNPLLPLEVTLAGRTLLHGSRTLGQYFGSQLHQPILSTLMVSRRAILDLGPVLPVSLVFAIWGLFTGIRHRRRTLAAVAASALLSLLLFFVAVPYREPRHLLAPLALAIAIIPTVLPSRVCASSQSVPAGFLPLVNAPLALFYWAKELANTGLGVRHAIGMLAAGLVVLAGALWNASKVRAYRPRLRTRWAIPAGVLLLLVAALIVRDYEAHRFEQWTRYWTTRIPWGSREPRPELAEAAQAWSLVAERTKGEKAVIAYAGSNLPYPLTGFALRNQVTFVPRNAASESWHFDWRTPVPDPFSGPSADAWLSNIRRLRVGYLCVFREVGANDPLERYPVEAEWAEAHGEVFRPISRSIWARVYEVEPSRVVTKRLR